MNFLLSPYGQFSSYLYYNPYYNPYDGNGNVKRILYEYEYYDQGFTTKQMENELYNAVLPSKDQQTGNSFLNNFAIEYDISYAYHCLILEHLRNVLYLLSLSPITQSSLYCLQR